MIVIGRRNLNNKCYVDDTVLMAASEGKLKGIQEKQRKN